MEKAMEYILLVNEKQSFSKAARKLFITQPALSAIVKKEEKKYGVKFFYRGVKPIILTEAGAKYIHAAKKVKAIDDSLYKTIKTNSSHHVNTITIGSSAYFCSNVLPSIISAFKKITPCNVQTYENSTEELIVALENGSIDFIIGVDDVFSSKNNKVLLGEETVILAVPRIFIKNKEVLTYAINPDDIISDNFLINNVPPVNFKFFNNMPFVLLSKGNDTYYRAKKLFRKYNIRPSEITYIAQLQSSYLVAVNGKGIVFIRSSLLKYIAPSSKMLYFKLDKDFATRDVYLYYRRKKRLSHEMS